MWTRTIVKAALIAPVLALFGCANVPSNYGLDDGSASLVRQTCEQIMGLRIGPEFEACGGSLADTMRHLQDANLTAHADQSCLQQGLTRGTAEHSKCVVMFRRTAGRSDVPGLQFASVPEAQPWQSYFRMSQAQQNERAELSCAQLGLHPAVGGFWHCVTDLKFSIANIRYENMP